jgi:S1-C subfamily serine protease
MSLHTTYKGIRESIVAFVPKFERIQDPDSIPDLPSIIGTGFVVDELGLIATNDHVIDAFRKLEVPQQFKGKGWPVQGILFKKTDEGLLQIPLEVDGIFKISSFEPKGITYSKTPPDVGFVNVKMKGLPALPLNATRPVEEGADAATAGYPMGTSALMPRGYVEQLTPTLQKGIISAVLPFECASAHAYKMNVMIQGGASGSPVFFCDTGEVLGILYASLNDLNVIPVKGGRIPYFVPTNISFVLPAHFVVKALEGLKPKLEETSKDKPTLEEFMNTAKRLNRFTDKNEITIITDEG